jgi:hypothetical protein
VVVGVVDVVEVVLVRDVVEVLAREVVDDVLEWDDDEELVLKVPAQIFGYCLSVGSSGIHPPSSPFW